MEPLAVEIKEGEHHNLYTLVKTIGYDWCFNKTSALPLSKYYNFRVVNSTVNIIGVLEHSPVSLSRPEEKFILKYPEDEKQIKEYLENMLQTLEQVLLKIKEEIHGTK